MAYQDELNNYFNELVNVFKGPLGIPDKQKIFSPLDIINASFIITQKYDESTQKSDYSLYGTKIEYTDPSSYAFCSGTGDTYKFLSLPFNFFGQSSLGEWNCRDDEGNVILKVGNIVTGESTKLLCLDENFNIVKDEDDNNSDCVTSVTNWDAKNKSGKYIITTFSDYTYLIFVQVRDKSQEVTNNG